VRHRTTLRNRIHATLIAFGHPCPVSDLFGHAGRELLDRLQLPEPWRSNIDVSLQLIDDLDLQTSALTVQLRRQGASNIPAPSTRAARSPSTAPSTCAGRCSRPP
jgi:transposase